MSVVGKEFVAKGNWPTTEGITDKDELADFSYDVTEGEVCKVLELEDDGVYRLNNENIGNWFRVDKKTLDELMGE